MKIAFLAGYFDAFGTYFDSLTACGEHHASIIRLDTMSDGLSAEVMKSGVGMPDLIVYCGINGGPAKPADADLKRLREIAPVVMICPEASDRTWWWKLLAEYQEQETFDLIVNIDGNKDWPGAAGGLTMLMPVDPGPWAEPIEWHFRYVECGFSGGNSNPYRAGMLAELKDLVTWRGPDPDVDARKTYHGYRDFMKQTKVAFNMPQHGTVPVYDLYARHVKGRVVEAGLAGCALVEGVGPTAAWFTEGEHYIDYNSAAEARDAITLLKNDPVRAQEMGAKLRAKVLAEHSPAIFWNRIFDRLRLKAAA